MEKYTKRLLKDTLCQLRELEGYTFSRCIEELTDEEKTLILVYLALEKFELFT